MILLPLCLIFAFAESIEVELYQGQYTVVETFDKLGLIYNQRLSSSPEQLCWLRNQQLVSRQVNDNMVDIIQQYSAKEFRSRFNYGHFDGKIPEILNMVQLQKGTVILTNQGMLFYLQRVENEFKIAATFQLSEDYKGLYRKPIFMVSVPQYVVIIFHASTLGISVDESSPSSLFKKEVKLYETFDTSNLTSVASLEDMIFVAKKNGVSILQLENEKINTVPWKGDENQIQDIKVFKQFDSYYIFLLDEHLGVRLYTYNTRDTKFKQNMNFAMPYPGIIMDVYKDVLIVVQQLKYESLAVEIQLNFTKESWKLVRKHKIQRDVQDIDITDMYAIILGKNGHQIIFHSLPQDVNIPDNSKFFMPSLLKLEFLKNQHVLVGVSRHKYYYTQLYLQPTQIVCDVNDDTTEKISVTYSHNSTKCPNKEEQQSCYLEQDYTILVVRPWISAGAALYIYLVAGLIACGFIGLVVYLIREFRHYQQFVHGFLPEQSEFQPKSNEVTINTFDSPNKFTKISSSHSRLPQMQLRD